METPFEEQRCTRIVYTSLKSQRENDLLVNLIKLNMVSVKVQYTSTGVTLDLDLPSEFNKFTTDSQKHCSGIGIGMMVMSTRIGVEKTEEMNKDTLPNTQFELVQDVWSQDVENIEPISGQL